MSGKTLLSPPRGTRDFFPEQVQARNGLFQTWREVSASYGFVEYDSCVLEHEELYILKSGEEIVDQLFNFTDKGGRRVALRPEMTPTLARMIASRGTTLARPLKWFSVAQCFRYERMARGRKREHYQWNLDIVGVAEVTAEAEVLATAAGALDRLGLGEEDVVIRISHRGLLAAVLLGLEIDEDKWSPLLGIIDKRGKEQEETIWALLLDLAVPERKLRELLALLDEKDPDSLRIFLEKKGVQTRSVEEIRRLFEYLEAYGIRSHCEFCPSIVRGLPYYTGIVFECFDRERKFRAVFGGGRYDDLLELFGVPKSPAVGLGFGDVVIQEILESKSMRPWPSSRSDFFLIPYSEDERPLSIRVAQQLRNLGFVVDLLLAPRKLKVALRESARSRPERTLLFLPEELAEGMLVVRDMAGGVEERVPVEAFLSDPQVFLRTGIGVEKGRSRGPL